MQGSIVTSSNIMNGYEKNTRFMEDMIGTNI